MREPRGRTISQLEPKRWRRRRGDEMWRCGNTVTNSIQWQTGWKQLFFFSTRQTTERTTNAVNRRRWWTSENAGRWTDCVCWIHQRLGPFGGRLLCGETEKKEIEKKTIRADSSLQIDFACLLLLLLLLLLLARYFRNWMETPVLAKCSNALLEDGQLLFQPGMVALQMAFPLMICTVFGR